MNISVNFWLQSLLKINLFLFTMVSITKDIGLELVSTLHWSNTYAHHCNQILDMSINQIIVVVDLELLSKELGVIAGLFQQIGGHSSSFVLFCSF